MGVTCPNCGGENPEGFRFCGFCTAPLAIAPEAGGEERKVVTVLFCDLVGFTASSEQADPEEVRARVRPYQARVRSEIESYGGTVEKFIGDAVMAVFGAPAAHEDDPERAVRAGLRILETIADLNEDEGLTLQVRIGIETGEAVVALGARPDQGEGMVTGDVVNTASRLQGAAPVSGVAVGAGTYAATKDVFDYEALEPAALKGKAEPVALWHAVAARARFGTDPTRRLTTPLVGRQIDLGMLTGCFQRAVQEHTAQLVTVAGEPGVGKSRLVAELSAFVDDWPDLIRWRQGRCLPYGEGITFWALGEIVKAEAGILETDSPQVAGSKLAAIVPNDHPDSAWLRARLRPLAGLEAPEATREENFSAWRAFLELLAEARPSVLVFEDLHWADDALLAFVEHLADYAQGVPLLLVATARPELYEKAPTWAAGARNANRINLAPLSEPETARLISHLLEQAVLPADVQAAILDRSGGNPLYAEEFVRLLKDREIVTRTPTTWSIDAEAEIPMPSSIQALVAARLDTLSTERKRLLQDAAVIGKVFWAPALVQMGERDPEEVAGVLHELSRKELVRAARQSSMAGQAEYVFYHALVKDVCYGQIPRAERAQRHERAAAWIEQAAGARVEDHAAILASHYLAALEFAPPGPGEDALRSKAVHYLTLAGERALGMDAEIAERHLARALELASETSPETPRILARHAEALRQRGRFADAARVGEEAIEGFRRQGATQSMAVAMASLHLALWRLGDPRARSVVDDALRLLEPLGSSSELVEVLTEAAAARCLLGEFEPCVALVDRAIALASELHLPEPARALGFRGLARAYLGDAGGVEDMRQALEAAKSQGLGRDVAVLYGNLAEILGGHEGARACLRTFEECLAFAERRGIEEYVLLSSVDIIGALLLLGFNDDALTRARRLEPRLEKANDLFNLAVLRAREAQALTQKGRFDAALKPSRWAIEWARQAGEQQILAHALPRGAALHFALQDLGTARALLEELAQANLTLEYDYADALPDAIRTALALGDAELARRLAGGFPPKPLLRQAALLSTQALLGEHERKPAEVEAAFAEAAEKWERLEMPWERAHALLGQGRCLLTLGRCGDALDRIRAARTLFEHMAAIPALAEADSLLERASARAS